MKKIDTIKKTIKKAIPALAIGSTLIFLPLKAKAEGLYRVPMPSEKKKTEERTEEKAAKRKISGYFLGRAMFSYLQKLSYSFEGKLNFNKNLSVLLNCSTQKDLSSCGTAVLYEKNNNSFALSANGNFSNLATELDVGAYGEIGLGKKLLFQGSAENSRRAAKRGVSEGPITKLSGGIGADILGRSSVSSIDYIIETENGKETGNGVGIAIKSGSGINPYFASKRMDAFLDEKLSMLRVEYLEKKPQRLPHGGTSEGNCLNAAAYVPIGKNSKLCLKLNTSQTLTEIYAELPDGAVIKIDTKKAKFTEAGAELWNRITSRLGLGVGLKRKEVKDSNVNAINYGINGDISYSF